MALPSSRPAQSFTVPTPKQTCTSPSSININRVVELSAANQDEFKDIQCTGIPTTAPLHNVKNEIKITSEPVQQPYSRLDAARLKIAKEYFQDMCNQGVCRRANSPWASPLHMVPKPDGSSLPCGDYCLLNSKTVRGTHTLTDLRDFIGKMSGKKFFSTIDLC